MNRREVIKTMFAGTVLATLPAEIQNACAEVVAKTAPKHDLSQWTHFMLTRTGADVELFLDGKLVKMEDSPLKISSTKDCGMAVYDAALTGVTIKVDEDTQGDFTVNAWVKKAEHEKFGGPVV